MSTKIELKEKIAAVDLGARSVWDELNEEQRKALKSELWILNRYISNVSTPKERWQKGKRPTKEEQEHFVLTVNEYFNKNWYTLQKHPKLLWQLLCLCSHESKNTYFHEWIGLGKRKSNSKKLKFLMEIYPSKKVDDLETLLEMMSDAEFKDFVRDCGYGEEEIKNL